jgi:hypothetical protein
LFIFLIVPPLLTLIWYTRQSGSYIINLQDATFFFIRDSYSKEYNYGDVKLVMHNKLASFNSGRDLSGLEPFRNLQIFTNDGQVYFITCLMYWELENLIDFFKKREVKVIVNNGSIGFKKKITKKF